VLVNENQTVGAFAYNFTTRDEEGLPVEHTIVAGNVNGALGPAFVMDVRWLGGERLRLFSREGAGGEGCGPAAHALQCSSVHGVACACTCVCVLPVRTHVFLLCVR
jgi:hypothetical protein